MVQCHTLMRTASDSEERGHRCGFLYAQCFEKITTMPEFEAIRGEDTTYNVSTMIQACRGGTSKPPRHILGFPNLASNGPPSARSEVSDESETIFRGGAVRSPNFVRRNTGQEMVRRNEPDFRSYASRLKEYLDARHWHRFL